MNPLLPLFLTVFFSVFHVLGGAAVGRGLRAALDGSGEVAFFLLWGAGMGTLPLVFDWFFLIAQGHLIYGLVGPILFIVALLAGAFLELKADGGAIMSAGLGSGGFLLGLLSIPLMLDAAKTANPGLADYVFGGCFVLLFVAVGAAFAWNGFSAVLRGISPDQVHAGRGRKPQKPGRRKNA